MSTIHDLPTSVLYSVLSSINQRSLYHTALVSRLFSKLSETALYHTYSNRQGDGGNDRIIPRSLISFTRTIVTNPRLARRVKKIDLGRWITPPETTLFSELQWLTVEDMRLFLQAGANLELSDAPDQENGLLDSWTHSINNNVEDAMIRLLICHLPKLEEISIIIGPSPVPHWTFVRRMARTPKSWPTGRLAHLKKLDVIHDTDDELGVNVGRFTSFFHVPSLREVTGTGWLEEDAPVYNWTAPPGASNITQLTLLNCALNEVSLRSLLETCKTLKSFTYSTSAIGTQQFTPRALGRTLRQHRRTLETLSLCVFSQHWEDFAIAASEFRIGSFKSFGALKSLDVEEYTLLGHGEWYEDTSDMPRLYKLLPASLERLRLTKCHGMIKVALVEMMTTAARSFPKLRAIEVVMAPLESDEGLAMLAVVLGRVGIAFRYSVVTDDDI